jgi:hypothetical protein
MGQAGPSPPAQGQAPFSPSARSLASVLKILINRASVDPGRELNGRSQQSYFFGLMWQGQSARRPVLPPSEHYRVLSGGLEGLAAGNRANTGKDTHASL